MHFQSRWAKCIQETELCAGATENMWIYDLKYRIPLFLNEYGWRICMCNIRETTLLCIVSCCCYGESTLSCLSVFAFLTTMEFLQKKKTCISSRMVPHHRIAAHASKVVKLIKLVWCSDYRRKFPPAGRSIDHSGLPRRDKEWGGHLSTRALTIHRSESV